MERKIHKSELDLLRWLKTRRDGCTVADVQKRYGGTRQSAYHRLERLLAKEYVSFVYEASGGPQQRARYRLTAAGRELTEARWAALGPRVLERRA